MYSKKLKKPEILFPILLISFPIVLAADPLTLEAILTPIKGFDISGFYDRSWPIMDLIISFLVFSGITKATIGKRFEGRAGNLLSIGISLALTIGFVLMEKKMNFTLRSFGALAGLIFVLISAFVLFSFLRTLGTKKSLALSLSYVITYLCIRLITPSITDWIAETIPWVNGILGIFFIVALVSTFIGIVSRKHSTTSQTPSPIIHHELKDELQDQRIVESGLERFTDFELKNSEEIIRFLESAKVRIEREAGDPKAMQHLAKEFKKAIDREHYAEPLLKRMEGLVTRLKAKDINRIKEMEKRLQGAPEKDKPIIQKEIELEKAKIRLVEKFAQMKEALEPRISQLTQFLSSAAQILSQGQYPLDAVNHLQQAIQQELALREVFQGMRKVEDEMDRVIQRGKGILRNEKKGPRRG